MMEFAIKLAKKCKDDVPVGAVIVKDGKIIAQGYNERELQSDITNHAEIVAIRNAEKALKNWRLDGCEMYVTLEPCPMCAWAILQSRIEKVYFGSFDKHYGALGSALDLSNYSDFKPKIFGGMMEKDCDNILSNFFKKIRGQND